MCITIEAVKPTINIFSESAHLHSFNNGTEELERTYNVQLCNGVFGAFIPEIWNEDEAFLWELRTDNFSFDHHNDTLTITISSTFEFNTLHKILDNRLFSEIKPDEFIENELYLVFAEGEDEETVIHLTTFPNAPRNISITNKAGREATEEAMKTFLHAESVNIIHQLNYVTDSHTIH